MTIIEVFKKFPTQKDCIEYLETIRWSGEVTCPYCGSKNVYKMDTEDRFRHHCNDCTRSFSVTVNTIMHDTRLPLQKWFLAISLISGAKKSIPSRQLARHLELPVKTAYSLSQRIRKAIYGTVSPLLKGIVEMDETYIGGKPRYKNGENKRGRGTKKQMVVGIAERNGNVFVAKKDRLKSADVVDIVLENVNIEESTIYTDDFKAYNKLKKFINHDRVNHSIHEYVKGEIHTNTIEGFWSLVKRAWYGTHHHYSLKYMDLYLSETAFKYNRRHEGQNRVSRDIFRGLMVNYAQVR